MIRKEKEKAERKQKNETRQVKPVLLPTGSQLKTHGGNLSNRKQKSKGNNDRTGQHITEQRKKEEENQLKHQQQLYRKTNKNKQKTTTMTVPENK